MFQPDYMNIVNAALNKKSDRIPMYEHTISDTVIEEIMGVKYAELWNGNFADKQEYFRNYCKFIADYGYDAVPYELWVGAIMPGSGALTGGGPGVIQTRADFDKYPWDKITDLFFESFAEHFNALRTQMPAGLKAIGGVGNGVFECVQELVGFESLCFIKADDEELYEELFVKIGDTLCSIWERFLKEFGDIFCVCRMGDDLGFKSSTLLPPDDVKSLIVPQYKRIVDVVHAHGKPFLLHSCGNIFNVMDDIINVAGINAKHSNEDAIAPFSRWTEDYGSKIGNFGGLDTDALCDINDVDIVDYTTKVYEVCAKKGYGVAIGSGNSIPSYVSAERYVKAIETIRRLRGE